MVFWLCGRSYLLEPDEALHVVGEVCKADLGPGTGDANGPDDELHPRLLLSEDMLHFRS